MREREREGENVCECVYMCMCVCVLRVHVHVPPYESVMNLPAIPPGDQILHRAGGPRGHAV